MATLPMIPLEPMPEYSGEEMQQHADSFLAGIRRRRTVRDFSDRPVPRSVIERCIAASTRSGTTEGPGIATTS